MAFSNPTDSSFPPVIARAPYRIYRDWCIGDSLTYINANSENFDTRIETVSSLVLAVSSYAVGLSARSTPTVTLNFNNRTNLLSAEVVNSSINTVKLGGDIIQAGKTLLTAANINALVDVNTSAVTNGQALIWNSGTSQWTNQNIALGTVTDGDKGDIVVTSGSWYLKTTTNFEAVQTANIRSGAVTPAKLSDGGPWWQQTGSINLLGLNNTSPNAQLTVGSNLGGTAASKFLTVNGGSFSTAVGATTALASFGVNTAVNSPASLGIKVRRNSSTPDDYTSTAFGLTLDYANVSNVTQLWLRGDGNVGIGTNTPQGRLSIASTAGEQIGFNTGTSSSPERGNFWYDTDGTGWKFNIGKRQSGAFTSQITIQDDGDVGIGTTVPAGRVTIEGSAAATAVLNALTLRNSQDGGVGLYFDNSTANNLASIEALVTSSGAGTDDGVLRFSTATEGTNTERIRITSTGDVGIGTVSPGYLLHARRDVTAGATWITSQNNDANTSSSAGFLTLANGTNNYSIFQQYKAGSSYLLNIGPGPLVVGTVQNQNILFQTNNTQRMVIDNNGLVGINTTTPTTTLDVNGDIRTTSGIYLNYNQPTIYLQDTNNRSSMIHCNSNVLYFLRGSGNNSTTWTPLSNGQWPLSLNLETGSATVGGGLVVQGVNGGTNVSIQAAAGDGRFIYFNTADESDRGNARARFVVGVDTAAETGSNAGSNFAMYRYADDGTYIGPVGSVNRANGTVTITNNLNVIGTISGTLAGSVINGRTAVTSLNNNDEFILYSTSNGDIRKITLDDLKNMVNRVPDYIEFAWITAPNAAGQGITPDTLTTLTITSEVQDTASIVSPPSSNTFTLPAGTYYYEAYAPHRANGATAVLFGLYNDTDNVWVSRERRSVGQGAGSIDGSFGANTAISSSQFVITSSKTFSLRVVANGDILVYNGGGNNYGTDNFTLATANLDQRTTIKLWKLK